MPEAELKFDDAFESALKEAIGGPEVVAAAASRPPGDDLQVAARRWRGAVQRRTVAEQLAYLRSHAEAGDLEARRRRYQTTNIVLVTLAVFVFFLFLLLVYKLFGASQVVALAFAAVVIVGVALLWPRGNEDRERLRAWRKASRLPSWSAIDEQRLSDAGATVEAKTTARRAAIVEAIVARLLSHLAAASFSVELPTLPRRKLPAGLRESPDTSFHVQTETGRRLARLIQDLNGGSFALVGARGTGKTDLLGALAQGAYDAQGAAPPLTVALSAPVSYVPHDFVLHLFAVTCSQTVDLVDIYLAEADLESALAVELQALRMRAKYQRQRLLNQVTSSLEASAAANMTPLGIGLRRNVSQSRLAYTYPEAVSELRGFLAHVESVLARYPVRPGATDEEPWRGVVVAIDELDRMEGPAQARAFLHEVKGVLGVRNCCFIVSMAEESLQSYDRDGQPLDDLLNRDFDEIVHMAYLDLTTCGRLLASRASPPFPEQFVGLCFCLAGGVARNVIRTARGVVGTALGGHAGLSQIAAATAESEMRSTVNWARARLARLDSSGAVGAARLLDEWVHSAAPGSTPRDRLGGLAALADLAGDLDEARFVRDRVLATAHFMLTIVEVFDDDLDSDRYDRGRQEVPFAGSFESLARARRRLPVNDRLAREMVHAFRAAWRLPELAW